MSERVSAADFFERRVPELAAQLRERLVDAIPEDGPSLEAAIRIDGEGGGEWVLRAGPEGLDIQPGVPDAPALRFSQRFEDWSGALYDERGGPFGRAASSLLADTDGADEVQQRAASRIVEALRSLGDGGSGLATALSSLNGTIRVELFDEEHDDDASGAWFFDVAVGDAPAPGAEPTVTIRVDVEDADAMSSGELDPMQAFVAGRIQVLGDLALLLQLQAMSLDAVNRDRDDD